MVCHSQAQAVSFSLSDLSPLHPVPRNHCLMVLKGYFDGARQPDRIVIAAVCGTSEQWDSFSSRWNAVLGDHQAEFLHTTDAVALQEEFSAQNGWSKSCVNSFIGDCVSVIRDHIETPTRPGLFVVTLTIWIADFVRAREVVPSLPNTVEELCTTESAGFCFARGRAIGADYYHLYYDQGEPFYGHLDVRMRNKKARKAIPSLEKVAHYGPANMRVVPALQMADLFAWCISHNDSVPRSWHRQLNQLNWQSKGLDYPHLLKPKKGALELLASFRLPKRSPTR